MRHEAIRSYVQNSAPLEADMLIRQHGPLVRRIAWHVHSRMSTAVEIEDLVQTGLIALVEAARQFEDRGIPFVPYATMRIRGAMVDELRKAARMHRSGMANRRTLMRVRERLQQHYMRPPTDAEIAADLSMDAESYHRFVASAQDVQLDSIEDSYSDHDIGFSDGSDDAHASMEGREMSRLLAANIAKLAERDAMVLNLYFVEEMNLHEIGEVLDLTPARVCQIKKSALAKLREMMPTD